MKTGIKQIAEKFGGLLASKQELKSMLASIKQVYLITGSVGKSSTSAIIREVLEKQNKKVFINENSSNTLSSIRAHLDSKRDLFGKIHCDIALIEIDAREIPAFIQEFIPDGILVTNLYAQEGIDWIQLLDPILENEKVPLIVNGDHHVGSVLQKIKPNTKTFGMLGRNLTYSVTGLLMEKQTSFYFNTHPITIQTTTEKELYNSIAALSFLFTIKEKNELDILKGVKTVERYKSKNGRMETIRIQNQNHLLNLFTSPLIASFGLEDMDNPTFNRTCFISDETYNDWFWEVPFEEVKNKEKDVLIFGQAKYELALRLEYAGFKKLYVLDSLSNLFKNQTDTLYLTDEENVKKITQLLRKKERGK